MLLDQLAVIVEFFQLLFIVVCLIQLNFFGNKKKEEKRKKIRLFNLSNNLIHVYLCILSTIFRSVSCSNQNCQFNSKRSNIIVCKEEKMLKYRNLVKNFQLSRTLEQEKKLNFLSLISIYKQHKYIEVFFVWFLLVQKNHQVFFQ